MQWLIYGAPTWFVLMLVVAYPTVKLLERRRRAYALDGNTWATENHGSPKPPTKPTPTPNPSPTPPPVEGDNPDLGQRVTLQGGAA